MPSRRIDFRPLLSRRYDSLLEWTVLTLNKPADAQDTLFARRDCLDSRATLWLLASRRFLNTLLQNPQLREVVYKAKDLLCDKQDAYDSLDDFHHDLDDKEGILLRGFEGIFVCRLVVECIAIRAASADFLDPKWSKLAQTPRRFNEELNGALRLMKTGMKRVFAIPGHRLQHNGSRDRNIWLAKRENPTRTWGQLGHRFGLTDGAAERAYKRQIRRERAVLDSLRQTISALCELYEGHAENGLQLLGFPSHSLNFLSCRHSIL